MNSYKNITNYLMRKTRGAVCDWLSGKQVFTNHFDGNSLASCFLLILFFAMASCNNNSNESVPKKQEEVVKNNPVDSSVKKKTILFFGNSLTAGYGVDPSEAYPALIQNKIDSLHLNYKVIN